MNEPATTMRSRDMERILSVSRAMTAERDLLRLLDIIVSAATDLIHADRTSLFVVDHDTGELWTTIAQGSETIRLPIGQGIAGTVAQTGQTINITDAYADDRFNPSFDKSSGYKTQTILTMPLVSYEGRVVGVLQALNKQRGQVFGAQDETTLAALCSQAAVALDKAQLIQRDLERQRLLQELALAQRIQQGLLPSCVPTDRPGWRFAAWQQSCDETGGDYYDFIPVRSDKHHAIDVVVGDVSGHGIGAALMMSSARASLRALHQHHGPPERIIAGLNDLLEADMADDTFMTMCLLRLHDDGAGCYVSAGHDPPLVCRQDGAFDDLQDTGILLGAMDGMDYDAVAIAPLQPGDCIVVLTDGFLEAVPPGSDDQFGFDRLRACIQAHAGQGADAVVTGIRDAVQAHIQGAPHEDDWTIVVAERIPREEPSS